MLERSRRFIGRISSYVRTDPTSWCQVMTKTLLKEVNKGGLSLFRTSLGGFCLEISSDNLTENCSKNCSKFLQKSSLKLLPKNRKLQLNQSENGLKNIAKTMESIRKCMMAFLCNEFPITILLIVSRGLHVKLLCTITLTLK